MGYKSQDLRGRGYASKFQTYLGVPQVVVSGVNTRINFDTIQFDELNEYDETVLYQFTPQKAGYYFFRCQSRFPNMGVLVRYNLQLFRSGVLLDVQTRESIPLSTSRLFISRLEYVTPLDFVYAQVWQLSGANQNLTAGLNDTALEGFRIG